MRTAEGWTIVVARRANVFGLLAKNMTRASIGRQWMAIRDMDVAAEVIGIRPMWAKLSAFAVSSFFVGAACADRTSR